jgi:hypothetical protein
MSISTYSVSLLRILLVVLPTQKLGCQFEGKAVRAQYFVNRAGLPVRDNFRERVDFEREIRMKRVLSAVLMVGGAMGSMTQGMSAQAKPSFSGTWTMNIDKSDLGQMPKPTSQTETITQTADGITIAIAADRGELGKQSYAFSSKFDGTETPIPAGTIPADSPFKILSTKAEWQGSALVITQKTSFQDLPGTLQTIYTLSDDGKMLTSAMHISFGEIEFATKTVYDKN